MSAFRLAIIGAGGVNFGTEEGPWNNMARLEQVLGKSLDVVALICPVVADRERVLGKKRAGPFADAYKNVKEYDEVADYLEFLKKNPNEKPTAFLIGVPPQVHGSTKVGHDMEIEITKALPDATMFIEKPVSSSTPEDVFGVVSALDRTKSIVSVGYMLRYLKIVQKAKKFIADNNLKVIGTVARYNSAYIKNAKRFWWIISESGGPVVEQGTHFCDLSRYFGGDVDLSTVAVNRVNWDAPCGELHAMPVDESTIPPNERLPRFTAATWRYKSGAVGSLLHCITLQGVKYDTCIDVLCDGYYLRMVDFYGKPKLFVRTPESDDEQEFEFEDDDPYYSEFDTFVNVVLGKASKDTILSSFEDAAKTYQLTKVITNTGNHYGDK
ncbi:NAD binding dehydrogenase [Schizosaccharomyces japonicus yFS275]|uniref:NAD binding dehydrogenase n=1 Tax=Schizosaccharomyces japonicus (strain yFS275 / FY16936) TaxID=402676 RepID=B6K6V8_SCHJY|nr:NAD binding dehydrogenase [Schizosaccharomyces japonicus yFS275]EEB09262.1 NAD binding dehydrogenase [Schizosaccharomyces japonicus yFS275]